MPTPAPSAEAAEPSSRAITRPRLHRGHFAFFRGVVDGLAPRSLWERYLPDAGSFDDGPRVHRMTGWIRQALMAAAACAGHHGRAHLLRLDLAAPATSALPSLDDFVARHQLDGFSEAEQAALYAEAFGDALNAQRRRTRLLHRQLWAIHTLESQLARPVSPGDGCEAWLVDSLARRLAAAGLATLGALHARMCTSPTWWQGLRGIGIGKATGLARFVAQHADTLGALPDWDAPVAERAVEIGTPTPVATVVSPFAPLERLQVPAELDGRHGRFRAPRASRLLEADDDASAIAAWLASKAPAGGAERAEPARLSATQLIYRREAERLLLWSLLENRTALSSLTIEDCTRFRGFLLDPPVRWCGPRAAPRWSAAWRPIEGPLSPRSVAFALGVLHNLFKFLVSVGYLAANPWAAVLPPVATAKGPDAGRALTAAQWQFVAEQLATLPVTAATMRLRVALDLLIESGIRLSELVGATTGALTWRTLAQPPEAPHSGWWLTVLGKGGQVRQVPVSQAWIDLLGCSLQRRGLPADLRQAPDVPLLGSAARHADATTGVSAGVFHAPLKAFFADCAQHLAASNPQGAARLRRASTHWLRHTSISLALAHGAPLEAVQHNAGHASLTTTSIYVTVEDARRARAMRAYWQHVHDPATLAGQTTPPAPR